MNGDVWKAVRTTTVVMLLMMGVLVCLSSSSVQAAPAPDANSVLILDPTVTGGAGSREAVLAAANGFTVVVDSAAAWGARTTAEFATFRAIILGDATCVADPSPIAAAEANKAVWGPAINGNVIINGTDPVYHQSQGGDSLTEGSIKFAADEPTKTGAYISLSCYYYNAASGTPVPVLDPFGSFTVVGQGGCPAISHIIAVHPALSGITDATLSNWGCSTHEGFVAWDPSFLVLAISLDVPSAFVAPDGTSGAPYILARGETLSPILCGNGILEGTEQCDDGNTTNGDGCSAQCTIEAITSPLHSVGTAQFTLRQERPGVADDQLVETATFTLPAGGTIDPVSEAVTIELAEVVCGGTFSSLSLPAGSFAARAGGKIYLANAVVADGVSGAPVTAAVRITREGGQDFKVSLDFKTADYICLEGVDNRKVKTTLKVGGDTMVGEQCFERLNDGDLFWPPDPGVVCP